MIGQNLQERELYILGTILNCNQEIKKFKSTMKPSKGGLLLESLEIQNAKTMNLFVHCSDITYQDLNENFDSILNKFSITENKYGNYYAYFQKVNRFLLESRNTDELAQRNGSEGIFTSLNEAFIPETVVSESVNILNYQEELHSLIQKLESDSKYNTIDTIPLEALKIKAWAKSPVFALGFNLLNSALLAELEKLGVTRNNLIGICYNRYHKQLMFFTYNLSKTLVYDIALDQIGLWNSINSEYPLSSVKLTPANYKTIFRTESEINDFVEIYFNINTLEPKFTDNMYHDNAYAEYLKDFEHRKQLNSLIK